MAYQLSSYRRFPAAFAIVAASALAFTGLIATATDRTLDAELAKRLRESIKAALSARHVPNEIFQVEAVPRTLSGKKMELPVKKLLMGTPAEQVFKLDAMANGGCVAWFVEFAKKRNGA